MNNVSVEKLKKMKVTEALKALFDLNQKELSFVAKHVDFDVNKAWWSLEHSENVQWLSALKELGYIAKSED